MAALREPRRPSAPRALRGWVHLSQAQECLDVALPDLLELMNQAGWADAWSQPSACARREERARWMPAHRQYLWRLEDLASLVEQRRTHWPQWGRPAAQSLSQPPARLASLGEVGRVFGKSAVEAGRELKRMGWRTKNGIPTAYVLGQGIARMQVAPTGRVQVQWDLAKTTHALAQRGWSRAPAGPTWGRPPKMP